MVNILADISTTSASILYEYQHEFGFKNKAQALDDLIKQIDIVKIKEERKC